MGWAALIVFAFALALFGLAWRTQARAVVADERIGAAIFACVGAACLGLAVVLWVAWVSFG